uniref:FBA_2 domain-containing protein n=1 Tax=Caenorhabditis tropicalis TaxID=1561998 RepID=A0A1I7UKT0_9PELO
MSDRHKCAHSGICFFENARENLETNSFPLMPIGTIGGIDDWFLTMKREIRNDLIFFVPFVQTLEHKPRVICRNYFCFLKDDGSPGLKWRGRGHVTPGIGIAGSGKSMEDWLTGGFLTNGGITVEYGFQIDGILDRTGIWTFNFNDRMFDSLNALEFLKFAANHNISNVIQLVDQEAKWDSGIFLGLFPDAIEFGLQHWLADFLEKQKTSEDLAWKLEKVDMKKMSGESMKKCVKRFFELELMDKGSSFYE